MKEELEDRINALESNAKSRAEAAYKELELAQMRMGLEGANLLAVACIKIGLSVWGVSNESDRKIISAIEKMERGMHDTK